MGRLSLSGAVVLAACTAGEEPPPEGDDLPREAVYVDCRADVAVNWVAATPDPGLAIAHTGLTGDSRAAAFVRDGGRRWDRAPAYLESVPVVVADHVLARGWRFDPDDEQWVLVAPDGALVEVDWSPDTSGTLPPGTVSFEAPGGLRIALTLEGWARFSLDGGATWQGSDFAMTEAGVARGDRALIQGGQGLDGSNRMLYTRDGGVTWGPLSTSLDVPDYAVFGDAGLALVDTDTLWVSGDHGETWSEQYAWGNFMAAGTGDAELWVNDRNGRHGEHRGLLRTVDGGASWTAAELVAGDAPLDVVQPRSAHLDAQGQQVLTLRILDGDGVARTALCAIGAAPGSLGLPTPARDDTPGSVTFWTPGDLPMPEPGQSSTLVPGFYPEQWGFIEPIPHRDVTAEGDVLVLLTPPAPGPNAPLEIWQFDGTDSSAVTARTRWDNLMDGTAVEILDSTFFQRLPDGQLRAQAWDGSGNYPFGGPDLPPRWGHEGRWGPTPQGPEYVGAGPPFGFLGVFERVGFADSTRCSLDVPAEDCIHWNTGDPYTDFALYDRWLYLLDRRTGRVLRHDLDGTVGDWEVVVAGLIDATELRFTWDLQDPGLFVRDEGAWWRFVPGDGPARRP